MESVITLASTCDLLAPFARESKHEVVEKRGSLDLGLSKGLANGNGHAVTTPLPPASKAPLAPYQALPVAGAITHHKSTPLAVNEPNKHLSAEVSGARLGAGTRWGKG